MTKERHLKNGAPTRRQILKTGLAGSAAVLAAPWIGRPAFAQGEAIKIGFPVPLTGFSKTFDGPPVDNAQYEAARRAMMEKFRERQMELANKAAEAQQKKEGAGAAPAAPAVPNATVAPPKMPAAGQ